MQQNMMGSNIIITESSSNLRTLGRNALEGKWKIAIIAVVIYSLCLSIPPAIFNEVFGINIGNMYSYNYGYQYGAGINADTYSNVYNSMPKMSPLSGIYELLVTGPFMLGITLFFLALFRKQKVDATDVFLGFEKFGKALGLLIFQGIFIFLWSCLLIVPGIIAAIRYSQAFFILADNPSKGIRECMDESKMMMKGNKAKYFCLTISFIGWMILASLPAGVIAGIGQALGVNSTALVILTIIGDLFVVPVTVYMYSTYSGFYEILAGHLIKETETSMPIMPNDFNGPDSGIGGGVALFNQEHDNAAVAADITEGDDIDSQQESTVDTGDFELISMTEETAEEASEETEENIVIEAASVTEIANDAAENVPENTHEEAKDVSESIFDGINKNNHAAPSIKDIMNDKDKE